MPELPEVRVVSKELNRLLVNKTIKSVVVYREKMVKEIGVNDFIRTLAGKKIILIDNIGKFIVFHLNDDLIMLSHLRMEGKYAYNLSKTSKAKHDHMIIEFSDKTFLHYNDTRVFGTLHLKNINNYLTTNPIKKMGPEPSNIDFNYIFNKLQKKNIAIKSALLDQTVMAGLGNIYVDEVLFAAKILPTRKAKMISKMELKEIIKYSISIMDKSTELGGSSIKSYTSLNKKVGSFQNLLKVHTKKDQPCSICKELILKTKVNGRGTYYCPNCQK